MLSLLPTHGMQCMVKLNNLQTCTIRHGGDDVLAHREYPTTIPRNFHSIRSWSHSFLVTQEKYHLIAKSLNFVAVYKTQFLTHEKVGLPVFKHPCVHRMRIQVLYCISVMLLRVIQNLLAVYCWSRPN